MNLTRRGFFAGGAAFAAAQVLGAGAAKGLKLPLCVYGEESHPI